MVFDYLFDNKKQQEIDVKLEKKFIYAIKKNDLYNFKLLFNNNKHIAEIYRDNYGNTLLHIAILFCRKDIMEFILNVNIINDIQNDNGETPLDVLIQKANKDLLNVYINQINKKLLLELEKSNVKSNVMFDKYSNALKNIETLECTINNLNENNKRLRNDNENLVFTNKKLKKQIETYISLFKN